MTQMELKERTTEALQPLYRLGLLSPENRTILFQEISEAISRAYKDGLKAATV